MTAMPKLNIIGVPKDRLLEEIEEIIIWCGNSDFRAVELVDKDMYICTTNIDSVHEKVQNETILELLPTGLYVTKTDGKSQLMIVRNPDLVEGGISVRQAKRYPKQNKRGTNFTPAKKKRK